jgi:AraC family transcriptional regulator of arabinose operon
MEIHMKICSDICEQRHTFLPFTSAGESREYYTVILSKRPGECWIEGHHHILETDSAFLISPGTRCIFPDPGIYTGQWLPFSMEPEESLPQGLSCNEPLEMKHPSFCSVLLEQIYWEQLNIPPALAETDCSALLLVLLNHMSIARTVLQAREVYPTTPYFKRFQALRSEIKHTLQEEHTIQKHADEMNISSSHFQHLYSQFFGISFQNDLIQMRIKHAKFLLATTNLKVEQVAACCGYLNDVHFFRQFKQMTGVTPAKYRQAAADFPHSSRIGAIE